MTPFDTICEGLAGVLANAITYDNPVRKVEVSRKWLRNARWMEFDIHRLFILDRILETGHGEVYGFPFDVVEFDDPQKHWNVEIRAKRDPLIFGASA